MGIIFTPNTKETQPATAGLYLVKQYHQCSKTIEYAYYDGQFFRQPMPHIWQASDCRGGRVCSDVVAWAAMPV